MGGIVSKIREHINNNKGFYAGTAALTLTGLADAALTAWNIGKHDTSIEGNSIMRFYIDYFGTYAGLMGFKGTMALAGVGTAITSHYKKRKWPDWVERKLKSPDRFKERIGNSVLYAGSMIWSVGALHNIIGIVNPDLAVTIERYASRLF